MATQKRQPPAFARYANKAAAKLARHRTMPIWARVQHHGRKSGKRYETPIAVVGSTSNAVYIALPWSPYRLGSQLQRGHRPGTINHAAIITA